MMYLGQISFLSAGWLQPGSLRVRFASVHERTHQLYIGRRMAGSTRSETEREIVVPYTAGRYPEEITIAAIDPEHVGQDLGSWLPPRPYNAVRSTFSTVGWTGTDIETDVRIFELFSGEEPGDSVNYDVPRGAVLAAGPRQYVIWSPPLGPSGEWSIGIRGRDTRESGGNLGETAEQTLSLMSYPRDFDTDFSVEVIAGMAMITATLPMEGLT